MDYLSRIDTAVKNPPHSNSVVRDDKGEPLKH